MGEVIPGNKFFALGALTRSGRAKKYNVQHFAMCMIKILRYYFN